MNYNAIITNIVLFIILLLLLSLWGFYSAIRPPLRIKSSITPKAFGLTYEDITLHTQDNVPIRGWFIPNTNPQAKAIILLHGYPADKGNILPMTYYLHKKYHLLYIDFRYLGESGGSYSTLGKNETLDLLAAIQFLKQRGMNDIGVWGFSLGGAVALMTAEKSKAIKAIVAQSSYAQLDLMLDQYYRIPILKYPLILLSKWWGQLFLGIDVKDVSPAKSAAHLTIPILIIHSKADDQIPFENAKILQNALRNDPHAEYLFLDNVGHGEINKQVIESINQFFKKYL